MKKFNHEIQQRAVRCLLQCLSPVISVIQLSLSQTDQSPILNTTQSVELGQSPKLSTTQYVYPYNTMFSYILFRDVGKGN